TRSINLLYELVTMCMIWVLEQLILMSFFFTNTATTDIYTLSLHDALPISWHSPLRWFAHWRRRATSRSGPRKPPQLESRAVRQRSEEHTSELQSRENLVCRLLLEKKKSRRVSLDFFTADKSPQHFARDAAL